MHIKCMGISIVSAQVTGNGYDACKSVAARHLMRHIRRNVRVFPVRDACVCRVAYRITPPPPLLHVMRCRRIVGETWRCLEDLNNIPICRMTGDLSRGPAMHSREDFSTDFSPLFELLM